MLPRSRSYSMTWPHCRSLFHVAPCLQGDTSPQGDPELYIASVRSLYDVYCRRCCVIDASTGVRRGWPPLIVNTHGWIKGIGVLGLLLFFNPV